MNIFNISSFHPRSILSWWYTERVNWYTLTLSVLHWNVMSSKRAIPWTS